MKVYAEADTDSNTSRRTASSKTFIFSFLAQGRIPSDVQYRLRIYVKI
jgi:hypothetical protein